MGMLLCGGRNTGYTCKIVPSLLRAWHCVASSNPEFACLWSLTQALHVTLFCLTGQLVSCCDSTKQCLIPGHPFCCLRALGPVFVPCLLK